MVKCEICGQKLVPDDLAFGLCPNCNTPISDEARERLLKEAGVGGTSEPPEEGKGKKPAELPQTAQCKSCGAAMPLDAYNAGTPCPSCGADPRVEPTPEGLQPSGPGPQPRSSGGGVQIEGPTSEDQQQSVSAPGSSSGGVQVPPDSSPSKGVEAAVEPEGKTPPPDSVAVSQPSGRPPSGEVNVVLVIGELAGKEIALPQDTDLGRDELAAIAGSRFKGLDAVSRRHFKFILTDDHLYITDLGSKNGTRVNQEEPCAPNVLKRVEINDRIVLANGAVVLRVTGYTQAKAAIPPPYRLRDEESGVTYPLYLTSPEIIGRSPVQGGPPHPFIEDIFYHMIVTDGDKEKAKNRIGTISRKQLELFCPKTPTSDWTGDPSGGQYEQTVKVINHSRYGTIVNGQKLSSPGDSVTVPVTSLPITIEVGASFRWILERA